MAKEIRYHIRAASFAEARIKFSQEHPKLKPFDIFQVRRGLYEIIVTVEED